MPRRILTLAVLSAAVVLGAWGCQQYNFNPVGSCVIQPGEKQVTLSGISTADILFVVDDSNSMDPKQQALAQNFSTFIDSLANAQKERVSAGLQPFDFHIAVTTSSIFLALPGSPNPAITWNYLDPLPPGCNPGVGAAGAPYPAGNFVAATGNPKVLHFTKDLAWAAWGVPAWTASTAYSAGQQATNANNLYTCIAAGTSAGSGGPTTTAADITDGSVHWKYVGAATPSVATLVKQFVGTCPTDGSTCSAACGSTVLCTGGNVEVGSCGSGEEQHLEAGRLAIQKALAGTQPGLAPGEWPHADSKMVVVFVGDEDDCSSPQSNPVVLSGPAGADTCVSDKNTTPPSPRVFPDGTLEYPISGSSGYEAFFSGLGRPFGAAFIVAANRCTSTAYGDSCAPADSTYVQSPASCTGTTQYACAGAYAAGVRHLALARGLEAKGISVVEGTVCESFGPVLAQIADLVKPPSTLQLDSMPAAKDITILRIMSSSGITQKVCTQRLATGPPPLTCKGTSTTCTVGTELAVCGGPGLCGAYTAEGWWFADCSDKSNPPAVASAPTSCIYINHFAAGTANDCEANLGETYSAEYLGQMPPGGCATSTCTSDPTCKATGDACGSGNVCFSPGQCCAPSLFCIQALLGPCVSDATCDAASVGKSTATCAGPKVCESVGQCCPPLQYACYVPSGMAAGTCVCRP
jgi:hypothetical protein